MAKKKEEEEIPILKEQERLRKLVKKYKEAPTEEVAEEEFGLESREYKEFEAGAKEVGEAKTFFEKACKFGGKTLQISMKQEDADKLNNVLYSLGYKIRANDVMGLSIFVFVIFLVLGGLFLFKSFSYAIVFIMVGLILMIGIQRYPHYLGKLNTIETMNMMPLAVTYMVIYMRTSPTLEGAVRFTAKHLSGSLARDLRGLVWGLESGTYMNMDQALKDYAAKWYDKNKNFSTAIEVIRNSQQIRNEKERLKMLDEAAQVVLRGNLETMKGFARALKMPVLALYMLCIVLPVMGLVVAPILTTLIAQGISAKYLMLTYNIILPLVIFFLVKSVMSKRPGAFSRIDISGYPGVPKKGHFVIKTKEKEIQVPLLPLAILVFILISIPGFHFFLNLPKDFSFSTINLFKSLTLIIGLSVAISIYTMGNSHQKIKIRKRIEDLESGLDVALYELGNSLSIGIPIEHAVEQSAKSLKKGAIKGLFLKISNNMRTFGMSFERALFDKETGALTFYPSKLVKTVMEVLNESARKGVKSAAASMLTIGIYLKNLRTIKSEIQDLIGSTVSSMRFQAQFLTSFITGIIISLQVLLTRILVELGGRVSELQQVPVGTGELGGAGITGVFKNSMFDVAGAVPVEYLQIIVGVYMIETTVLLSLLINGVINGRDNIYRDETIGINLIISTMVYIIAMVFGVILFSTFKIMG